MKTPKDFQHKKTIENSRYQSRQEPENSKNRRNHILAPLLLALPVIFIIIALTKVLASEETEPLEREVNNWKTSTEISADTVVRQAGSTK